MQDDRYDDSSSALGLGHNAVADSSIFLSRKAQIDREYIEALQVAGIACDEHGIPQIQHVIPRNAGAHDDLIELLDEGVDLWDALEYVGSGALAVQDDSIDRPRVADYLGDSIESLMARQNCDPSGSGSKGRKHTPPIRPVSLDDRARRFDQQTMEHDLMRKKSA
jgi:hypothetical protein